MKKIRILLALLTLAALLAGCGKTPAPVAPDPDPGMTEEPAAEEETTYLCYVADYGQLYAQPLDGSAPRRLLDKGVKAFCRLGDDVLAVQYDGALVRIHSDGTVEELTHVDSNTGRLLGCDRGVVYESFSMSDGYSTSFYDFATGISTPLAVQSDLYESVIVDNVLLYYYNDPAQDYAQVVTALELDTMERRWDLAVGTNANVDQFYTDGTNVLMALRRWSDDDAPASVTMYRIGLSDGAMTEVEMPYDMAEYRTVTMPGSGGALVEGGYETHFTPYFIDGDGIKHTMSMAVNDWGFMAEDAGYNHVLVRTTQDVEQTVLDETVYGTRYFRYLVDLSDGSVKDVTDLGVDGRLFESGDFPVLDSSTARKPVTLAMYRYFCMNNGIDGAQPLCSTTHNAWLNIADRKADIALLAAPTAEEEAYLKERGVDVEMKLYGGDGLVFIANKECGVENLTLDQVRAVYRGEITNWAQLGGADHSIRVLYRDDQSGSQRLFEKLLFKGMTVPDMTQFERLDEMSTIVDECLWDPYAIGYSIMTYLNDVYDNDQLQLFALEGVPPTPDGVLEGTYPLGTQGYVVIRSDESQDSPARRLYDWIGCPVCDNLLTGCGVTPLHSAE